MSLDPVTWLFVPGDRPDRFAKAAAAGADRVICDLEDAVAEADKDAGRRAVRQHLAEAAHGCWVRVNAIGTPAHRDDIEALADAPGLRGVVVPKAESARALVDLRAALGGDTPLMALVESAAGIAGAVEIASCGAVDVLAFGSLDFALDIGADHDDDRALLLARSTLVLAARVAGLPAPVDGVTADIRDPATAARDARRGRALGFGGKLCIHPAQIAPVADAFAPSAAEVAWARGVVARAAEADGGAIAADGQMIDLPVLARARRILAASPDRGAPDVTA